MRVRILLRGSSVGGPPRVSEAVVSGKRGADQRLLETCELAGAAPHLDAAIAHHGHASRVVPAILEAAQSLDENRNDLLGADVADDTAHVSGPYFTALSAARRRSSQPGLFSCRLRAIASDPAGTSCVIDDPAAT